ncbi:hypothetical protein CRI77_08675 [Mycolicibacterium duvalii]|uniref:Uncharacterized protein n=1 Tax=Mycolicibacterium duvalii TaxID=39688 RepID=A0A7I7JWH0_9MYCO|nr:hypothetical protein [Mycolicibacterium duvalii]MCV7369477.1 hypothetical protein [Mycolicibacterium duvalii]PEG42117.1 hypothetical protein CRI77_08675 [Mycolicibacterium duvalii]BBX16197.1 hypothetical protein MDUV_10570 [Mycolicibacterium duvalii]
MGEIARIDLDRLSGLADRVSEAIDRIAALTWPRLEPGALPGSALSTAATPHPVAHRIDGVVTDLRDWVMAARAAADAFAHADSVNAARMPRR